MVAPLVQSGQPGIECGEANVECNNSLDSESVISNASDTVSAVGFVSGVPAEGVVSIKNKNDTVSAQGESENTATATINNEDDSYSAQADVISVGQASIQNGDDQFSILSGVMNQPLRDLVQQGDVYLFQSNDEGEINVEGGIVEMRSSLETSAYVSLFGGNEDDDGSQDNTQNWWGNVIEDDPAFQYRSRLQNLLRSIPSIPANLRRLENAALLDLQWFIDKRIASELNVVATLVDVEKVRIDIEINAFGDESTLEFTENWRADT